MPKPLYEVAEDGLNSHIVKHLKPQPDKDFDRNVYAEFGEARSHLLVYLRNRRDEYADAVRDAIKMTEESCIPKKR